jgi:hypothetical protein
MPLLLNLKRWVMESKNRKFAVITVDTNDADYLSQTIEINEEQALMLARVAAAIKGFEPYEVTGRGYPMKHRHNFPVGECLRTDLGELSAGDYYVKSGLITEDDYIDFMDLVPYTEHGFHTVTTITILAVIGEIKLL